MGAFEVLPEEPGWLDFTGLWETSIRSDEKPHGNEKLRGVYFFAVLQAALKFLDVS